MQHSNAVPAHVIIRKAGDILGSNLRDSHRLVETMFNGLMSGHWPDQAGHWKLRDVYGGTSEIGEYSIWLKGESCTVEIAAA